MSGLPTNSALEELRSCATLQEYHFRSPVPLIGPLIAWFRDRWNSVSTRWYVRPLIQQQSEFNQRVVEILATQDVALADTNARLEQYDARLVAQDHEQSTAIGDLSATAMRLIQVTRHLDEIERRLVQLEDGAMAEDRAASEERMT